MPQALTARNMRPFKIVVIGSGIAGYQVAAELQKLPSDVEVTLCSVKDETFGNTTQQPVSL